MADLEDRVNKLEEKVRELEININKSLSDIKIALGEIKASLQGNSNTEDLKNNLIKKDVQNNTERISKLEGNQAKIVWTIILAVLGLIGEAVVYYLQH